MNKEKSGFFLVREEILPEAIKKTIRVKEMLKRGDARTINEAVEKMELSRSAYYKYKDYVFPFYEASRNKIVTLTLLLEHKKGVLSSVLNTISADSGSVMTINQGIPLQGVAKSPSRRPISRSISKLCSISSAWSMASSASKSSDSRKERRCVGWKKSLKSVCSGPVRWALVLSRCSR